MASGANRQLEPTGLLSTKEGREPLKQLLGDGRCPLADRQDAALVLALIGAEQPLRDGLAETEAPVALRRRAAESLGLLARRSGDRDQRDRIGKELEGWLRSDALNLLVVDTEGWAEHDARLPLLQGASRGLQLAASADLPLFGSGPIKRVPMLTLTALEEGDGLRIVTEVVKVPVWQLPLPAGEQLELVLVPAGEYTIGSPKAEAGRDDYSQTRQKCAGVDVEALRQLLRGGSWIAVPNGAFIGLRPCCPSRPGSLLGTTASQKPRGLGCWFCPGCWLLGLPDCLAVGCRGWRRRRLDPVLSHTLGLSHPHDGSAKMPP
jgi:hypothetical protein